MDESEITSLVPENVQAVFNAQCAVCHAGSSPPEGLNLSQAYAYESLVNVNSSEQPSVKRVHPGQPDNSYLVRKIEGVVSIDGDRMPADGPPYLSSAQIDTVRLWIANGALPR
jgi:mono/diheme cytochrome c family protein